MCCSRHYCQRRLNMYDRFQPQTTLFWYIAAVRRLLGVTFNFMFNQVSHIVAKMKFPMSEWPSGVGCLPQCMLGYTPPVCPAGGEVSAPVHAGIHTPCLPSGGWGVCPSACWDTHPLSAQRGVGCLPQCMLGYTPPLWTKWQTLVKILPCRKYVSDGN